MSTAVSSLIQNGLMLHSECAQLRNYVKDKIRKNIYPHISLSSILKNINENTDINFTSDSQYKVLTGVSN